MVSILVVDDEANIRELVSVYLTAAGYSVDTAEDGIEALAKARSRAHDLIVLDIMLPGMDGAAVCSAIRAESRVPIIMLTARDTDLDKVAMLEAGADDYVVKPFSPPEFVARVRAILRRSAEAASLAEHSIGTHSHAAPVSVGGLSIDPATRDVIVDGAQIALTTREFDLLYAMAGEPGVVFSRETLLERAVGFADFVDARGIDVHVRHLREKLGDEAATPRFIETVRGVGYRVRKDAW
jgi:two-component system response regulator ResD